MASFAIQPIQRFRGSSAVIGRPRYMNLIAEHDEQEIACFSYDEDHQYHPDGRSIRYYYPPNIGADLSRGFDTFRQLDDSKDDHLESLLKTLILREKETGAKCNADIISWRGMMTKIMATPYDNMGGNGFEMNATYFQGTIFIEENHDYKLKERASQSSRPSQLGSPSQDLMSFWGYKFETLCLLPDTWDATPREYIESREEQVVSNYAQYCSIVKTRIGNCGMILGGEVDAGKGTGATYASLASHFASLLVDLNSVWDEKPSEQGVPINWLELKTSATVQNDRDMLKYERKLLKFWIQSFLLGVPKILVGFRSKNGILERLEQIETKTIPGLVKRNGKGSWDGNLCINFTAAFLEWLKLTISSSGAWRIRRQNGASEIEVFKYQDAGYGDILSDEFVSWRMNELNGAPDDVSGGPTAIQEKREESATTT